MKYLFKFEFLSVAFLMLIFISDSFLLQGIFNSTNVNVALIGLTVFLFFSYKFNLPRVLMSILVISLALTSFILNVDVVQVGGYRTLILYMFTLLFFSLRVGEVNNTIFYRCLILLSLGYLIVNFYFYASGLQQNEAHLFYIFAGAYLNQNTFSMGLVSLLSLIILIGGSLNHKKTLFFHSIIFFLSLAIILTQARASMLSSAIILLYFYRKKIYLLIPLTLVIIVFFLKFNEPFYNRVYQKFTESGSGGRVDYWINAFNDMSNSTHIFWFGEGAQQVSAMSGSISHSLHNSYMNYLMSYGVPSFISLIFIVLYILFVSFKNSFQSFIVISSLFLYGMFETVLFGGFSAIWLTLIIAFLFSFQLKKDTLRS